MPKTTQTEPTNHDYTDQFWGHSIGQITPLNKQGRFSMMGHGEGIKKGHTLTMSMQSGRIGKFSVNHVAYLMDPSDMFSLEATMTGYID
jgi:hypothetical protein